MQRWLKNRKCNVKSDSMIITEQMRWALWGRMFSVCWQSVRLWQILAIFGTWQATRFTKFSNVITAWRTERTSEGLKWKWWCYISCWYYSSCLQIEQGDQRAPTQEHFSRLDQSMYRNESLSDVSWSFTVYWHTLYKICKQYVMSVYIWGRLSKTQILHCTPDSHFWINRKVRFFFFGFFWAE